MTERRSVDVTGSALLAAAAGLLLLGLLEGGLRWEWASPASVGIFAGSAVLLAAFVLVERRAPDPVLPLWVFRNRVLNAATIGAFVVGVLMMGVTSYIPVYAQRVLGSGATVAGLAVAALAIGWPIAASTAGRVYLRWGFRPCLLAGAAFGVLGSGIVALAGPGSSIWQLAVGCLVLGLGLGYVASPSVIAAQSAVTWRDRGVATGTNMFSRSVGSAVGVAAFGALANGIVASRLGGGVDAADVDLDRLAVGVLEPALSAVFVAVFAVSLTLVVAGVVMPSRVHSPDEPAEPADVTGE